MRFAPSYASHAYGAASAVPAEISSVAGSIIGIPGGDTLYVLPSAKSYTHLTDKKVYTAPTYSIYVLEAGQNFPYSGLYIHTDSSVYPQATGVLVPIIQRNEHVVLSEEEWRQVSGSSGGQLLPESGTSATTAATTPTASTTATTTRDGRKKPPSVSTLVGLAKTAAGPRSGGTAQKRIAGKLKPAEETPLWQNPWFWAAVGGVVVVGGIVYVVSRD